MILLIPLISLFISFTPPGTQKIKGTDLYIDISEVSNNSWREYLFWIKKTADSKTFKAHLPDSDIWGKVYQGSVMKKGKYDYSPVVGITYEQALAYCLWRSQRVSQISSQKVVYSLPTLEEYQKVQSVNTAMKSKRPLGLCGKVQEMTAAVGIAMANDSNCGNTITYKGPSSYLGFRCIAQVLD